MIQYFQDQHLQVVPHSFLRFVLPLLIDLGARRGLLGGGGVGVGGRHGGWGGGGAK